MVKDKAKAKLLRDLYKNQFHGKCSSVLTMHMWSSGWGADISHILDGLMYSHQKGIPFQVAEDEPWHYAAPVEAGKPHEKAAPAKPVCPRKNMHCYFLQTSNCAPGKPTETAYFLDLTRTKIHQWYQEFLLRKKSWLRHRIYQFVEKQRISYKFEGISMVFFE